MHRAPDTSSTSLRTDRGRIGRAALLLAFALAIGAAPARAVTDSEGMAGSGQNDSYATAQSLGDLRDGGTLVAQGWVSLENPNDVDFYTFELVDSVGIYVDIDLADDPNAESSQGVGLDSALSVFDAYEYLVAYNDDSDFFVSGAGNAGNDPGSDIYGNRDPFLGTLFFGQSTITVAVSWWANNPNAYNEPGIGTHALSHSGAAITPIAQDSTFENDAVCSDPGDPTSQCVGAYTLIIRTTFLPEPASAFGAVAACMTLAMLRRRRQTAGRAAG